MAECGDDSLGDSVSTISVDSITYNNLSVSVLDSASLLTNVTTLPTSQPSNVQQKKHADVRVSQGQVLDKFRDVEAKESEIEHVLLQNNKLMRQLLHYTRENKSNVTNIKTENTDLKKKLSEYKSDLVQKDTEIRAFNNSDKNSNAQRMKIDQAAATVKDLRDQLYEKERLIEMMKCKIEQEYTALATENSFLKAQLGDSENNKLEHEQRCDSLSCSLEENQLMIDTLSEQLMKEKAVTDDYKGQLAVLSCQVTELKRYYSMERHVRKQLQAKLQISDPSHFTRPGMEGRGIERNLGAALAASHGEQTAPPSSPYIDYNEHRHY